VHQLVIKRFHQQKVLGHFTQFPLSPLVWIYNALQRELTAKASRFTSCVKQKCLMIKFS